MLQEQIITEIDNIPNNKLNKLYDLVHCFRFGLLYEQQESDMKNIYPSRGSKMGYEEPFEPVWGTQDIRL